MLYKKMLAGCLVLGLSLTAMNPLYKQYDFNSNNLNNSSNIMTKWYKSDPSQLMIMQDHLRAIEYKESTVVEPIAANSSMRVDIQERSVTPSRGSTYESTQKRDRTSPKNKPVSKPKKTTINYSTSNKPSKPSVGNSNISSSSKATAVIQTAKSYLGIPYVWGGDSPSGFDCSGYIKFVLVNHGIDVPRTASEQFNVGTKISKDSLKVGDLVFFTTYKPGPSHIGFYLGEGQFIHASSAKEKVTISNMNTEYYTSRYLGARRVID